MALKQQVDCKVRHMRLVHSCMSTTAKGYFIQEGSILQQKCPDWNVQKVRDAHCLSVSVAFEKIPPRAALYSALKALQWHSFLIMAV